MSSSPTRLSVVLPVYNVSPWVEKCLDSIFQQTHPAYEVIAVDDGSTDLSHDILTQYASIHPELHIIRQKNSGLSVARNSGLDYATGTHLIFIDSDDFIEPTMFEKLLDMAIDDGLDMALCNGWFHFEDRKSDKLINSLPSTSPMEGKEYLKQLLSNKSIFHAVWMHLYRIDFIRSHNFHFIAGQVHEDVIWTNEALLEAQRVRYIDEPLYYYRIRQQRSGDDKKRRSINYTIPCSITNTTRLLELANNNINDNELIYLMQWQGVDSGFSVFHLIEKITSKKERLRYINKIWNDGFFRLMWKNANSFKHKRKITRLILRKIFQIA